MNAHQHRPPVPVMGVNEPEAGEETDALAYLLGLVGEEARALTAHQGGVDRLARSHEARQLRARVPAARLGAAMADSGHASWGGQG